MLVAHVVPGYCIAAHTVQGNQRRWSPAQQALVWLVGLGAAIAPDADIIYNALLHGFIKHSILWPHSVFPYLGLLGIWLVGRAKRADSYLLALLGVFIAGNLSHLLLDAISHGTPLLYPLTLHMFGAPSTRILYGGARAYLTDPLFLLEPALLSAAAVHWLAHHVDDRRLLRLAQGLVVALWLVFCSAFLAFLPALRQLLAR